MAMSYAAYLVARLYVIRFPPKREALPPRGRRPERFFTYWAWAFAVIAIVFGAVAGPGNLFAARFAEGRSEMAGMSQQFLYMARSLSLLAMVMMIYLSRYAQARKLRRRNFLAIFVFLPAFLVINYYAALPRFVLFGSLLALVVNFVDFTRPPMKILVTGGAIFTLFAVFPIIKLLGTGTATLSELVAASGSVRIDRYFLNVDFDGYMQIVSTVAYIAEGGELRWGNNFLGVALFFVPRALWAGKPIDSGEIVSTNLSYWYTNVSSPLPAESLISFNLFGPPIVFFILGLAIARVEYLANKGVDFSVRAPRFFVGALWAGFLVIILRGALNGVAPMFATGFLAYLIMMYFFRHTVAVGTRK